MALNPGLFLEYSAAAAGIVAVVGLTALTAGSHSAREEFRSKGYLRPPSGRQWFRFLLLRHYEVFAGASIRFFYGVAHLCLLALFVILIAVALLGASTFILSGVNLPP